MRPHSTGPYPQGHYPPNPFDAQSLGAFASSLDSLPADESRKAKSLFIRNAIAQHETFLVQAEAMKSMHGCGRFLPGMRAMVSAQHTMLDAQTQLFERQLENALEVWKDDLRGERFEFEGRKFEL
ncbi:MAG: hypothetical protein AAF488_05520 [Planctomycetota bacterium]